MQQGSDGDKDISWDWSLDAPPDTGLMLMLGWVPGLFYAGLLFLGRTALQRPQTQVVGAYDDPRRGGPFMT